MQRNFFINKLRYLLSAHSFPVRLIIFGLFSFYTSFAQLGTFVTSVEAENGVRAGGVTINNTNAGYSGTGYVTNFTNSADKITVTVNVPETGFYSIVIRYNGPYGNKTQYLIVNNSGTSSVYFPQTTSYSDLNTGKYLLNTGANTITIQSSWGWTDIDKFSLYNAVKNIYNITPDLVDSSASTATKSLYDFLVSQFGKKIISGQTNDYYDTIKSITGRSPLLRVYDFQHYTQGYPYLWVNGAHSFGWHDDGSTQKAIAWYNSTNKKGMVSFQWHWHSPTGGAAGTNTFSTSYTSFDITKAVQPGTTENTMIIRDIDSIASQLKKLQNAGVPVLWRPLHEAGGGWFWWGAKGPEACKKLYGILFNRLKNFHNLHNLIWVWSTPESDWYPGNDSVDIVGYDSYPPDFDYGIQKNTFDILYTITNGQKIIAMSENGAIPNPEDCLSMDAPWSYFMSWSNLVKTANTIVHIRDVYLSPNVLTLESLPTRISYDRNSKFRIFPNPARQSIRIEGDKISSLELLDMNSRMVFSARNPDNIFSVDQFGIGVYFLRLYNKNRNVSVHKLIINE